MNRPTQTPSVLLSVVAAVKAQVPTCFTLCNVLCGLGGLLFVSRGCLEYAFYFICLAALFDALDGASARVLHALTDEGKMLDSLADMLSFGALPALMLYTYILRQDPQAHILSFTVLGIALAAALRLARFSAADNNDAVFLGVPTPAAALFLSSIPLLSNCTPVAIFLFPWPDLGGVLITEHICAWASAIWTPWSLAVLCWICTVLMVLRVPMLSLKFEHARWQGNRRRYIFLCLGLLFLVILKVYVFVGLIPLYVFFSLGYRTDTPANVHHRSHASHASEGT